MSDSRLVAIANDLLTNVAQGLADEGINVPPRQYIHSGDVAADFEGTNCADALIVTWVASFQGQPGQAQAATPIKCSVPLSAGYTVFLLRCVPTLSASGQPPTVAALQGSGEEILTDAMTLPKVIIDLQLSDDLLDSIPGCSLVGIGNVVAFGPEGGVGGSSVDIVIGLV